MVLDGKYVSGLIRERVKGEVALLNDTVKLLVILVGNDPASQIYVASKEKACKKAGIKSETIVLEDNISQKALIQVIQAANDDPNIHGILLQLPLPKHLVTHEVINYIDPKKDVDGLTDVNQGKLFNGEKTIVPATPKGIMHIINHYHIELKGKNAVVIGRSNLVGKPISMLLLDEHATVTMAHSRTSNLKEITKKADIIVSAVGKPLFITADMVKQDAVIIDVGINRLHTKVVGDVDYKAVEEIASAITPVPGGVGPMTIASLLENVVECYKLCNKL